MFKAKIVTNNNGKQTVVEFDNEQEYYDYLESHPEVNQSLNRNRNSPWGLPSWSRSPWSDMDKLVDQIVGRRLGYGGDQTPLALVKQDMQRMEAEEKQKEQELRAKEKEKEQRKKELAEAKELLKTYKSKDGHNEEYAKKLEAHIKELE